jgi:hypothetical protein
MTDNDGGIKMSNNNWVDITKHDTVIIIAASIIILFLGFLGYSMA